MPSGEVQTDAVVRHALSSGKHVYVPYLHRSPLDIPGTPARVMDMVRLRNLADYESLVPDRWGIPSIDPATVHERERILGGPDAQHSERSALDLVLMPGVAFDLDPATSLTRRCGHGKGFYDFFIHRYSEKVAALEQPKSSDRVLLYGLALTEQFLTSPPDPAVPSGPLDRTLDGVILGSGEVVASQIDPAKEP
jgi:5-formyltetrahydrofolate cyclo-ligase